MNKKLTESERAERKKKRGSYIEILKDIPKEPLFKWLMPIGYVAIAFGTFVVGSWFGGKIHNSNVENKKIQDYVTKYNKWHKKNQITIKEVKKNGKFHNKRQ